jgi:hypothetical protein
MKIFFGAAIQGARERGERSHINSELIDFIKSLGHEIWSEQTTSNNYIKSREILEKTFGSTPQEENEFRIFSRNKMIEGVEGDIQAAIFEVSLPSLGTGIEIAHAYLRPKMGLKEIPLLFLYQKESWSHGLSSMIRGITREKLPLVTLSEYPTLEEAKKHIEEFLGKY